ncbi:MULTISPECIES: SDR family NAD(P)-dependent oxidoreductase [Rhodococcus]|uniref:SDR family NAD(P)-dependent oxidoreductase n=1 Tax=Rhodococcus TaxID=1827 RepID=UPI000A61F739|nr:MULTISPECIES: SDR family NAD(P)-dependent oxidoreductase [Rhodococcus]QQZ14657.1 SDR family oxidoreductase [Rhodococcus sp. 21391]
MGVLDGKVALVTGAIGDMGRAACRRFAAEGAAVVATDVTDVGASEFVEELTAAGHDVEFYKADITDSSAVNAMAEHVRSTRVHVDTIYNNAGVMAVSPLADITDEQWHRTLDVNLTGVFLVTRAFVPLMRGRRGASITNVSSMGGFRVYPTQIPYGASKAGCLQLTQSCAVELAPDIRVNAIAPGCIDTQMARGYADASPDPAAVIAALEAGIPLGRMGTADEVVNVGVWLASDQASYVTGAIIVVDGGSTLEGK